MNPEIFRWARETSGWTVEQASKALSCAVDTLRSVEQGDTQPSRPLLLKMVKQYRRPLITFYLNEPPKRASRGEDFRTLPTGPISAEEPLLDALLRDVQSRQDLVRDTLLGEDEDYRLSFIGSMDITVGVATMVERIVSIFGMSRQEFRAQRTSDKAFTYLRSKVEANGVFVLLVGNLGSHTTNLSVDTFRGYTIADHVAPFIVINDQDAKTAWSFTLMHELAHLILGASGVSSINGDRAIEKFCNDVAAAFLLEEGEIHELGISMETDTNSAVQMISDFAGRNHLSRRMVSYSLYRAGIVSREFWRAIEAVLSKKRVTEREKDPEAGGPTYYILRRHRLGPALLDFARHSVETGALSPTKASIVLGVKPINVYPLLFEVKPGKKSKRVGGVGR